MQRINWQEIVKNDGKFERLEYDVQYQIEIGNWRMAETNFGKVNNPIKKIIEFDIYRKNDGTNNIIYEKPKTWSISNPYLVKLIGPMIDQACDENRDKIMIMIKKTKDEKNNPVYSVLDLSKLIHYGVKV